MRTMMVKGYEVDIVRNLPAIHSIYSSGENRGRVYSKPMVEILCVVCLEPKPACIWDLNSGKSIMHHGCRNTATFKLRRANLTDEEGKLAIATVVFNRLKANCKHNKRVVSLTLYDILAIVLNNCHYCNASPQHSYNNYHIKYNGIDRVNNSIDYIKENCVACCFICNRAKATLTKDEFIDWIKKVYEFQSATSR